MGIFPHGYVHHYWSALGTIVAAFLVYFVFGVEMGMQVSISYLSNSLFLALAATFPDVQFLLFFIIPVKAK